MKDDESVILGVPMMAELLRRIPVVIPKEGDLIEGTVISIDHRAPAVYVDFSPAGTGIILGREYLIAKDTIKVLTPGDSVTAKVIEPENELGYIELSLKGAKQEIVWREADELEKERRGLGLAGVGANKGRRLL